MEQLNAELPIVGETYRHFKGNSYVVTEVDEANNTVRYLDPFGKPWTRDLREFFDRVNRPEFNYAGPRFVLEPQQLNAELPNAIAWKHSAEHHHAQSLRTAAERDELRAKLDQLSTLASEARRMQAVVRNPALWPEHDEAKRRIFDIANRMIQMCEISHTEAK